VARRRHCIALCYHMGLLLLLLLLLLSTPV
jgi:hypothetical protein